MDNRLLERYFANDCTPEEARQVLTWLNTPPGRLYLEHRLDDDLRQSPPLSRNTADDPDFERVWNDIQQRRHQLAPLESLAEIRPLWSRHWIRYAAAACVLLVAFVAVWIYRVQPPREIAYQTSFGQTRTVQLPDQSVVTLNGNSTLHYAADWENDQPREVWVEGEAFFKVTHTASHQRFVVHLPDKNDVEVLGTQFNVYARNARTRVVLNSGKIRLTLHNAPQPILMKPGELVETNQNTYQRRRINTETYTSWRNNRLTFDNTSLADVIQTLQETYGLSVEVRDPRLLQQRISGSVPNENADVLLEGLESLLDLKVVRSGSNQIIIESLVY